MSTALWGRGGSHHHSMRGEVTRVHKAEPTPVPREGQSWLRALQLHGGKVAVKTERHGLSQDTTSLWRQGLLGRPIQFRYIHHCCLERILSENEKPREEQNQTKPTVSAGLGTDGRERIPFIPSVCQGSAWMHKGLLKFRSEEESESHKNAS